MVLVWRHSSLFTRHALPCAKEIHRRKTEYLSVVIKKGPDSSGFLLVEYSELQRKQAFVLTTKASQVTRKVLFREFFPLSTRCSHWSDWTWASDRAIIFRVSVWCSLPEKEIHINILSTHSYWNVSLLVLSKTKFMKSIITTWGPSYFIISGCYY